MFPGRRCRGEIRSIFQSGDDGFAADHAVADAALQAVEGLARDYSVPEGTLAALQARAEQLRALAAEACAARAVTPAALRGCPP